MQNAVPIQKEHLKSGPTALAVAGLSLVCASVFGVLACQNGLLYSGISAWFVVTVTTVLCAIGTFITLRIFKRNGRHLRWRLVATVVAFYTITIFGFLSWKDTRKRLEGLMHPSPVPDGVRVLRGRSLLFSYYVHFTGPPELIERLIKAKGLVLMPDDPKSASDLPGFGVQIRTKDPWDWWQPVSMSKPKFFFREHDSKTLHPWFEGWWVNEATNEVYAHAGG